MSKDTQRALEQAKAQLDSIIEMVEALHKSETDEEREEALQTIQDDPLSVDVRSGWVSSGCDMEPEEYSILLCTGGPAVRITGSLDLFEPDTAKIEYQDWFTPWVDMPVTGKEEWALLEYARQFYFSA
jgi:hypothetical protein